MATNALTQELLQTLVNVKRDIKSALIEKNSTPEGGATTYADAIRAITTQQNYSCNIEYPSDMVDISVVMDGVDITDQIISDGTGVIDSITGNVSIILGEKMLIDYYLTNTVSSNTRKTISRNATYTTTLSFDEGYEFSNVTITMGGVDITNDVFNPDTGVITIPAVDGIIEITAASTLKVFNITSVLLNASSTNNDNTITYGQPYTATITPNEGYNLIAITAIMDGQTIPVENGVINIDKVIGDISILVTTSKKVFNITNTLSNVENDNVIDTIEYGDSFVATLTPIEGYEVTSTTVTMGGEPISVIGGIINIPRVTGDIIINASAVKMVFTIVRTLTNVVIDNLTDSIEYGLPYNAIITPNDGFNLGSVMVTMGGTPVDVVNGAINIDKVTGNIEIIAAGAANEVNVINTLTNVTNNNVANTVVYGGTYSAVLTADEYYDLTGATITMGGVNITATAYSDGNINIDNVTADIEIIAVAQIKSATITSNFTSVASTNANTSVDYKTRYTATLSSTKKNWAVNSIQVLMGGVDITDSVVNDVTIDIPMVTGNIIITATASRAKDIGFVATTNNVITINDGELPSGTYTMRYEDIDGNPIANEDDITTFTI